MIKLCKLITNLAKVALAYRAGWGAFHTIGALACGLILHDCVLISMRLMC